MYGNERSQTVKEELLVHRIDCLIGTDTGKRAPHVGAGAGSPRN